LSSSSPGAPQQQQQLDPTLLVAGEAGEAWFVLGAADVEVEAWGDPSAAAEAVSSVGAEEPGSTASNLRAMAGAAVLSRVAVSPAARRRGVATQLLAAARSAAAAPPLSASDLCVLTLKVNKKALTFYAAEGFTVLAEERRSAATRRGGCLDGVEGAAQVGGAACYCSRKIGGSPYSWDDTDDT
jgi:GNAT superfamily N-acetyltransferase